MQVILCCSIDNVCCCRHLSEYADKLQKDLPTDARPLFNVEKWMQYQLSSRDKLMDLPQSNLYVLNYQLFII